MNSDQLIENTAEALCSPGWVCLPDALPDGLSEALAEEAGELRQQRRLHEAAVGRGAAATVRPGIRRDRIHWLDGSSEAQRAFLEHMQQLRFGLNRALYAGLQEFESHFSHYPPGAFYKRHLDSFRDNDIRRVSCLLYLNPDWDLANGGQLRLFDPNAPGKVLAEVSPQLGTWVCFLSHVFEHEVCRANAHRHAIAGWMRRSSDNAHRPDPMT